MAAQTIKWLLRCALLAALALSAPVTAQKLPLEKIKLPPGFAISVFADNVPNARAMALGDQGTLFVGSMRAGKVYAIKVRDNKAVETLTIASGLNMPVGVAFRSGALYVSEVSRILRYDHIEANLATPPRPVVVSAAFPPEAHHGWKFIAFGPDGMLYVPVGAPCNICDPDSNRYANIMRIRVDKDAEGSVPEVFARGVRNSVGFDWHPATKELWFPDEYRNNIFIAEHGSWNRSQKIGYRIVRVALAGNQPAKHEVFAEGWLQGQAAWGRPADVLVMHDGALLVSDDQAGAIYRISYRR